MFKQLSNNSKAIILAITGFSAFSVADAVSKWLTQDYPALLVVGVIAMFSFTTAVLASPFLGGLKKAVTTKNLKVHLARGILNTAISMLVVTSFESLPIALVYTLIFVTPFLTSLFAVPVYGERVQKNGWIAIGGGFVGVLIVMRPGVADFEPAHVLPLIAACLIAGLFLLARAVREEDPPISLPLFPVTSNLLLVTPLAVTMFGMPAASDLPLFLLSGVSVMIGLICTAQAFRTAKASLVSPFLYSQMIWAVFFGFVLFDDIPDPWTLLGAAIIIGSGVYLIETERRMAQIIKI